MITHTRTTNLPLGYPVQQAGMVTAVASATAALPLSLSCQWLYVRAQGTASETVYMGFTSTVSSGSGFGLLPGIGIEIPLNATTNTIYFQCASGSSPVHYLALGF